jgi:hypothetical protein
MILEGGVNAEAFEASIEQILVPSLQPGQTVIMDNLRVHKTAVHQLIEDRGCHLLILPISLPSKRPSPRSRRAFGEQVPEPEKRCKRPSLKRFSPSHPRMLMDGFVTAVIFHRKKGRANKWLNLSTLRCSRLRLKKSMMRTGGKSERKDQFYKSLFQRADMTR